MVYIYILKLEDKDKSGDYKYYIGKTTDPNRRLLEHENSQGASWTKLYKPIETIKIIPDCSHFDEDKYTLEYMSKYGIDNVRGGSFCQVHLSKAQVEMIQHMINGSTDKCFKCGKTGHFAKECPNKTYDIYDINNPEYKKILPFLKISKNPYDCILGYIYKTISEKLRDNIKLSLTDEGEKIKQIYIRKFNDNQTMYYLDENELVIAFDNNYNFDENNNYEIYTEKKIQLIIALRRYNNKILILKEDKEEDVYYTKLIEDRKKEFISRFYNQYSSNNYAKYLNHNSIKKFDKNYNFEQNPNYEIYRERKLQLICGIKNMKEINKQIVEPKVEPKVQQKVEPKVEPKVIIPLQPPIYIRGLFEDDEDFKLNSEKPQIYKRSIFDDLEDDDDDFFQKNIQPPVVNKPIPEPKLPPPVPPKPTKIPPPVPPKPKLSNIELIKLQLFGSIS